MPNYQESSLVGSQYTRFAEIIIRNPFQSTPTVQFVEERAFVLDDGRAVLDRLGDICVRFDPEKMIPIVDPETIQSTGQTIRYADAYVILYSAALQAAHERDAAAAPAPGREPPA